MTRGVGVFRPLTHELPADAYSIDLDGVRLWFSTCGAVVVPLDDTVSSTADRPHCPDCPVTRRPGIAT